MKNQSEAVPELSELPSEVDSAGDGYSLRFVMGCIVFLMQLGFCFLEAGSVRSDIAPNILLKNMLQVGIAALCYWACGWALAFGNNSTPFFSYSDFFLIGMDESQSGRCWLQFALASAVSLIVSGPMAERTHFMAYVVLTVVITTTLYPVASHWAWHPQGCLHSFCPWQGVSFLDVTGSAVVHCLAGLAGFIGAVTVGPRKGFFGNSGTGRERLKGNNVPFVCLGSFILFFGFIAVNASCQLTIPQQGVPYRASSAAINTALAGFTAGITALLINLFLDKFHKHSLAMFVNGTLAGMVAMCASGGAVHHWASVCIGIIAGLAFMGWSQALFRAGVDDALDAVAVHLGGGLWGIIAAPLFLTHKGLVFNRDMMALKQLA